jgi:pimeloyl-ACP methyl ester carboxylesterase
MQKLFSFFRFSIPVMAIALLMQIPSAQAARLSLSSDPGNFNRECVVSVNIELDTEGVPVNAVDMFLNYNTSQLTLIDQIPGINNIQIQKGNIFPVYASNENEVNTVSGEIKVTAFDMFGSFNGSGVFATLVFQSNPGVGSASLSFDFTPGNTLDSNVADLSSNDVLSSVGNQSYNFSSGPCNPDTQAPVVTANTPNNGGQGVALDADVTFTITDNQSGVDTDSIAIQVHTSNYTTSSPEVSFNGDPLDYDFVIDPSVDFPFNEGVTVVIQVEDVDGNVMAPKTFSFNAPDSQPPTVANVNPGNGAKNIPLDSDVLLDVRDNELGVDIGTVKMTVNDVDYSSSSPEVTFSGDPLDYSFTINPSADFPELTEISIVVEATDLGGNVMDPQTFTFNKPPAPAVCGDNVVEGAEQCEPAGTLGCDENCQIAVDACLTETALQTIQSTFDDEPFIQLASQNLVEDVTDVLFDIGIGTPPVNIAGVELKNVAQVESFVCDDAVEQLEQASFERKETPYTPPEGFQVIQDEIAFSCDGAFQTTINLPQEYAEVQAVKCVGGVCNSVEVSATQKIQCGEETIVEKDEQTTTVAQIEIAALDRQYDPARYSAAALPKADGREYIFRAYNQPITSFTHPSLQLMTAPAVLERTSGGFDGEELVMLTMPYVDDSQVNADSVQVYALDVEQSRWQVIQGRELITERLQVQVELDLAQFNGDRPNTVFAVMGIRCESCDSSNLRKVYEPESGGRAVIVLVHDLSGVPEDWRTFIDDISRSQQPWQVWSFEYPVDQNLKQSAQELTMSLQLYEQDYDVVYLVGHGIGGTLAQESLAYAHRENTLNPNRFPFLSKVKRTILLGTPDNSTDLEPLMLTYYNYLVNSGKGILFGPERLDELLGARSHIPRIPGVEYFAVAGTETYEDQYSLSTASLLETNDGFVATKSAQAIGGLSSGDKCRSYWEVAATHDELPFHPDTRRVIGQLVSRDVSRAVKNTALLGYQQYFRLADASCSSDDRYILIGKKIKREKAVDPLECGCGNGYCGIDEDKGSCPQDCANVIRKENYPWLFLIVLVLGVALVGGVVYKVVRRRRKK